MSKNLAAIKELTTALRGRCITSIQKNDNTSLILNFNDETKLTIVIVLNELMVEFHSNHISATTNSRPSKRQVEYLAFIAKYIARFGRAPAESDIQRHFLVSAPSVNQMIQTLERNGFISRQRGVPRSIKLLITV